MGREVRRVPATWEHPKDYSGKYRPMYEGPWEPVGQEFIDLMAQSGDGLTGLREAIDYFGSAPNPDDYMPTWLESEMTHFQMYENTSEGTPISPPMPDPESLARWLADNNASAFGGIGATYEQWLPVCAGGFAPSMVIADGKIMSGVEHVAATTTKENQ